MVLEVATSKLEIGSNFAGQLEPFGGYVNENSLTPVVELNHDISAHGAVKDSIGDFQWNPY